MRQTEGVLPRRLCDGLDGCDDVALASVGEVKGSKARRRSWARTEPAQVRKSLAVKCRDRIGAGDLVEVAVDVGGVDAVVVAVG